VRTHRGRCVVSEFDVPTSNADGQRAGRRRIVLTIRTGRALTRSAFARSTPDGERRIASRAGQGLRPGSSAATTPSRSLAWLVPGRRSRSWPGRTARIVAGVAGDRALPGQRWITKITGGRPGHDRLIPALKTGLRYFGSASSATLDARLLGFGTQRMTRTRLRRRLTFDSLKDSGTFGRRSSACGRDFCCDDAQRVH
jgi:hypothetical protein